MRNQIKKIYNRGKELYFDATIFLFRFFIVYILAKKMETEKWPKAADSPLRDFFDMCHLRVKSQQTKVESQKLKVKSQKSKVESQKSKYKS